MVPLLLVVRPLVVADEVVDVAEEVVAGWNDVVVFPPAVMISRGVV